MNHQTLQSNKLVILFWRKQDCDVELGEKPTLGAIAFISALPPVHRSVRVKKRVTADGESLFSFCHINSEPALSDS